MVQDADWEKIASAQGILCFHEFIRKEMQIGNDVSKLAERLIQVNPQVVLVSDEVGYGIVPIDPFDRAYREAVGRVCTKACRIQHAGDESCMWNRDGDQRCLRSGCPSWNDGGKPTSALYRSDR